MEKNIPADVVIEIMRRIGDQSYYDTRDLIALKSVSKFWNHVISNLYIPTISPPKPSAPFWGFICFDNPPPPTNFQRYFNRHRHNPTTFLRLHFLGVERFYEARIERGNPTTMQHRMLSLIPGNRDPNDIKDCCNGLLLISYRHNQYYVANPVTMHRLSIPLNPKHTTTPPRHSSLVFDPSLTHYFKIVTFNGNSNHLELEVFCSETWGWSTHVILSNNNNMIVSTDTWLPHSVYFNRALYYMSQSMYLVCIDNIIDDHSLRAWAIELPDRDIVGGEESTSCGCIGGSSGSFRYSNRNKQGCSLLVWMLQFDVYSTWILTHTISMKDVIMQCGFWADLHLFRACGFFPNDDVVLVSNSRRVFRYHLETRVAKELFEPFSCRTLHLEVKSNYRIFPFSPCLLLLDHDSPQFNSLSG